jgi:transcriptional regulator GlxA family with amidase domain
MMSDRHFIESFARFFQWLRRQHDLCATICSVCTGAVLLAHSGLLDGRAATTHWKFQKDFAKRFPRVQVLKNRLFVHSDGIYCSAGMSSGIDLALHLLQLRFGHLFASNIAREVLIYFRRGEEDPQLSIFVQYRNHINDRIHLVQDWLVENMSKKVNLEQLGKIANTSPRHLTRSFKTVTGITIGSYVTQLRYEHARNLLKEGAKVEEVAEAVGFRSTNQLRSLLRTKPKVSVAT